MKPQSNFMVVAPIEPGRMNDLKTLLDSMTDPPGMAKLHNSIVPFGDFDNLHYARFVILDDQTLEDFKELGQPVPKFPITLAFFGDCDGPGDDFLADITQRAAPGLRQIFSHCAGFTPDTDLLTWMKHYSKRPAAAYVNYRGRTVRQVHEESKLRKALLKHLADNPPKTDNPRTVRDNLLAFVGGEQHAGRLTLSPPEPTPLGWWTCNLLHFAIVPCALLLPWVLAIPFLIPLPKLFAWVVIPFLGLGAVIFLFLIRQAPVAFAVLVVIGLLLVPFFILFPLMLIPLVLAVLLFFGILRCYERNEREFIPRPTSIQDSELAKLEDHDVTNQFTELGSVKPSVFRRWMFIAILWITDYAARHIYTSGFLSRIQSIHFARWVFLDDRRRMLFASNYDGSRQAYMDDFINKVGWGLNIVFSNGFGYPRTNWLVRDGCKNELRFKDANRRHQIPTQVWYRAYPGLTAFDLARNTRVRQGIERHRMNDAQIRKWLSDL